MQELFEEMFQGDIEGFSSCSQPPTSCSTSSSSYALYCENSTPSNKRNSSAMNYGNTTLDSSGFDAHFHNFCVGVSALALMLSVSIRCPNLLCVLFEAGEGLSLNI